MKNIKFVIWWDSPCKGMINVLKYFCEDFSPETVVITGDTGSYRKSMGWCDTKKCFKNHTIVEDANWEEDTMNLFHQYRDYVHVFNGITRKYFIHLLKVAVAEDIPFFIMTEAYSNLEFGIKRIIKQLYIDYYLPVKIHAIAKKSLGIFCLSGNKEHDLKQFHRLGFAKNRIVPFGYWTEPNEFVYERVDNKLHILCPGVLKKYKGVDVLIRAVAMLKSTTNNLSFLVHITGLGVEKDQLELLTKRLNVEDVVVFHGALNEDDYKTLLSKIDVLVAPGYVEPWGIRVNEAIQRGQIVICSDGLGACYLVEESGGGYVFESGNVSQLCDQLNVVLSLPFDKLTEMKEKNIDYAVNISCRRKAEDLFNSMKKLCNQ